MRKIAHIRSICAVISLLTMAGTALAQAAAPAGKPLSFEVASVKPSKATVMDMRMTVDGDRVDIVGFPLLLLICRAYMARMDDVVGNPSWLNYRIDADRFDISAKIPEGATQYQVPQMLQTLLGERFKVATHHETRDMQVYALIVGNGGPKLEPPSSPPAMEDKKQVESVSKELNSGGSVSFSVSGDDNTRIVSTEKGVRETIYRTTMAGFAKVLSGMVMEPVVDLTELKGEYKVSFEFSTDALMTMGRKQSARFGTDSGTAESQHSTVETSPEPSGGSIVDAVRQIGLKLERRKLPRSVLVIDHAEKTPTEN